MNTAQVAHVRAHVAAVAKLVLGDKIIKPSMSIIAGEPLDAVGRLRLGEMATETQIDIIHLEFAIDGDGAAVMTGINLVLPRDALCYSWTACRLSLLPGQTRAVIAPRDQVRGHFKILPGEIVQVDSKPHALTAGIARAEHRLAALVRDGVDVNKQVILHDWC